MNAKRWTRAQAGLAYATVLMAAFSVFEVLVQSALGITADTRGTMSLSERILVAGYLLVLRYLPFLAFPAAIAPAMVALLWFVPRRRPASLEPPAQERRQLTRWLWWLAAVGGAALASAGADRIRPGCVPIAAWMWVSLAFPWAYAGALHRSLKVHALRAAGGATRIPASALAVAAALATPFQPLGIVVPLWVLWASRGARAEVAPAPADLSPARAPVAPPAPPAAGPAGGGTGGGCA